VGVGGYAAKFQPPAALKAFRTSIESIVPLTGAKLVERRGGWIPVGSVLENVINPRGLLLGDAAGAVSPLTAGGLDPCLRLSELAAKSVHQYLATGDPAALAVYDGRYLRRRYLARRALRRTYDLIGSNAVLELGFLALRTPVGRQLAEKVFFSRGESPISATPVGVRELAAGRNSS
jgi:flavin-dependent dehydrogenase